MKPIDLVGQYFGDWFVVQRSVAKRYYWTCNCRCGTTQDVYVGNLRSKSSTCCAKCRAAKVTKHGMSDTTTYNIWAAIKERCTNTKAESWNDYGGRGITLADAWLTFDGFYRDMGTRPAGMSINRRNNDGNYCKANCEWATATMQNRNTRATKLTFADAMLIRYSTEPKAELATKHNIKRPNVYAIQAGKTWKAETLPQMVAECYAKYDMPKRSSPGPLDQATFDFRLRLLREELKELEVAVAAENVVDTVDALCDLVYVAIGTLLVMGVTVERIDQAFTAIQKANMSKVRCETAESSKRKFSADLRKPEGWVGPEAEIARILGEK